MKKKDFIKGGKLKGAWTLGSKFDMDSIVLKAKNGTLYRMKSMQVIKAIKFCLLRKREAIKHTYLEVLDCTKCGSLNVEPFYETTGSEEDKKILECQDCGHITHEDD